MSNGREETKSMALFCDFENVALGVKDARYRQFDIKRVLERLLLKGSIVVKKAYCDWERYREFKAAMHQASFELIEIPHVRMSGKNSADIRMVVDALDLCYTKSHVDTFVIISGDSDFSPLVSKLRENNKTVIGVGVKNSTSDLLIANCDEFIYYDDLVREQPPAAAPRGRSRPAPAARGPERASSRPDRPARGQGAATTAALAQDEPQPPVATVPVVAVTALRAPVPDAATVETAASASPARSGGRRRGGAAARARAAAQAVEVEALPTESPLTESTTVARDADEGAAQSVAADAANSREPLEERQGEAQAPSAVALADTEDPSPSASEISESAPVAKTRARRTPVRRKTGVPEDASAIQGGDVPGPIPEGSTLPSAEIVDAAAPVAAARQRRRSTRAAAPMVVESASAESAVIVPEGQPDAEGPRDRAASVPPREDGKGARDDSSRPSTGADAAQGDLVPASEEVKPKRATRKRKVAAEAEETVPVTEATLSRPNPALVAQPLASEVPLQGTGAEGDVETAAEGVQHRVDDGAHVPAPAASRSGEDRALEALDLVVGTIEALVIERGDADRIWGSMIKQTLKRRRPGFNESYYGYRSFNQLLEDARDRGMIELERDEKSGGYTVRSLA